MQEDKNKKRNDQINIELDDETAQGIYANLAIITHSSSEFILDFVRMMPGVPKAKVQTRMILTPEHAKRLLRALQDNVEKYESQFGKIKQPEGGNKPPFPVNFGGPTAQA